MNADHPFQAQPGSRMCVCGTPDTDHESERGYNDGRTDRSVVETFRSLRLRVAGDGATITVDTSAVADPHGVHALLIEREALDSDVWHHYPSGVSGSLAEILIGVAWSYVRFPVNEGIGYE